MPIKLNQQFLDRLPGNVSVPKYDRSKLSPGILHMGVGNFHRAHQAIYLNRLFDLGDSLDWAIIGAGTRANDAEMRRRLHDQDWLTTIVELEPSGLTATVCGSMVDFIDIDPARIVEALARPEIRIVSLTITEGGYYLDATTGGFQSDHPEMLADGRNPQAPKTVFGLLLAGIERRRQAGLPPFTVMSCDNLPENGKITRQTMIGLAQLMSGELAAWVEANVAFPNSMVDCITPATSDRMRQTVAAEFDILDSSPVACEPFRQWVLEDNFPQGRPALEKVGVEFVDDVAPYELMKLRILNGGHASIAYPAALIGIDFVHDAMAEPLVSGFLESVETREIIPTVPLVPGVDFSDYFAKVKTRFSNAAVADTIPRLCLDGSNRQPKFILPTIADRLKEGLPVDGLALEVALWCRYCFATDDAGNALEVADAKAEYLRQRAQKAKDNPSAFLDMQDIFGLLGDNAVFVQAFSSSLRSLWDEGTRQTLAHYIAKTAP
ncbi:MAG: mannitol dehydrogenase family protein [Rhizobiaceae bacterium]|nr:mannitol dehydrogenase family protein [Rhizobiaceae bacterium]